MTEAELTTFDLWAKERAKHFEWYADSEMPKTGREPKMLIGAMRYAPPPRTA